MSAIPKAVLYYYRSSVWSAVALLALQEKGYGQDEVDLRIVDLSENFDPTFLRLNPKATVPTLVVPLQKTLSEDVDSRYRAITDTKAIVEFLDKSRSAISRTNTTSYAPAPTLTPATIDSMTTCKTIIELLHSEEANPNHLWYLNARTGEALKALAQGLLPSLVGRQKALARYISDAETGTVQVSVKVKALWKDKKTALDTLLDVLSDVETEESQLGDEAKAKREEFLKIAHVAWEVNLKNVLTKLNAEIVGPYTLGDQFSIADLHIAGWLARLVMLTGGSAVDDGNAIVGKLEVHIGNGFSLPRDYQGNDGAPPGQRKDTVKSKLGVVWDSVKERSSWKQVYREGLF